MSQIPPPAPERSEPTVPWTDRAIEVGALFLMIFTPLAFGTVDAWSQAVAEIVILAMGVLWVLGMLRQWELRLAVPPAAVPCVLFLVLGAFQMVPLPEPLLRYVSPRAAALAQEVGDVTGSPVGLVATSFAPAATRQQWMVLLTVGLFLLVVYNAYRTRAQVRRLLWTMLGTTAAIALFSIVQRVTWNGRLYWIGPVAPHEMVFGPFVNRAHFAGLAIVAVPMALAMLLAARRDHARGSHRHAPSIRARLRQWRSREAGPERLIPLLILVAGAGALVSGSRGGAASFLAALAVMLGLGAQGRAGLRQLGVIAVAMVAIVVSAVWVGSDVLYGTLGRMSAELGALDESSRARLWRDAVALWQSAPLVGTGLGSFGVAFEAYRSLRAPVVFTHAESDWVQLLTDTGVIGVALVAAALGAVGLALARQQRGAGSPWQRRLALGALVAVAGTALQWVANYNLPVMSNLVYLAAAVAVALPLDEV